MNLLEFIVKRKVFIGLMTGLIVMLGAYAVFKVDKELIPVMEMDEAYVEVLAGDMPVGDVERKITEPIEKEIHALDGVEKVTSISNTGNSSIQITVEKGRIDETFNKIESITNRLKAEHHEIEDVMARKLGSNQNYEFYMDISGENHEEISAFAKDVLKPRLEELKEVRDVYLSGLSEEQVTLKLDQKKVENAGLNIPSVIQMIQEINGEETLGEITEKSDSTPLRWNTKFSSMDDIKNTKIQTETGFVKLADLAKIEMEPLEQNVYVWKNGNDDLIFVQVGRNPKYTQLEMAKAVRKEIEQIRSDKLVMNFTLNEMLAQADYVEQSIDGVSNNILIGAVVAIVILLLFLRDVRATVIIAISIPTSALLTFLVMWLFGYSFNLITLIGLGLGIGMMVDASIVILESIYRKKELGLGRLESVLEGTKEVAGAVVASMLTTIVVFLPIGFVGGDIGKQLIILSMVVAITLISSVVVAFTLIPTLSERFLKEKMKKQTRKKKSIFMTGYANIIGKIVQKKRNSIVVIIVFFVMFAGSLLLTNKIPTNLMPDIFNRYNEIFIQLEPGLTKNEKQDIIQSVNDQLKNVQDVKDNYIMDVDENLFVFINMTTGKNITLPQEEVNENIYTALRTLQDKTTIKNVQSTLSAGGGAPVQVNIEGDDFIVLQKISQDISKKLENVDGIAAVTNPFERTMEEQVISIDEKKLEQTGLSKQDVKNFISSLFINMPIGEIDKRDAQIPIHVKLTKEMNTEQALLDLKIPTAKGEKQLREFVHLKTLEVPNRITHIDNERYVGITADLEGKDLGAVNREVQKIIKDYKIPDGYDISLGGDLEQQQELLIEIAVVLAIALFLVYFVMAVQFNHLGQPIIVMSVIPMALIGVILGLFVTQMELNMLSSMGVIVLIGIVLNNAILLIDRTNQLRNEGLTVQEALIEAGLNRIRPIFMTTLTTVAGMLPLALDTGTSSSYQAPLATVIITGLLFATCITLFLIPAIYRLFTKTVKKKEVIGSDEQAESVS